MATKGEKLWEAYKNHQPIEQAPAINTGNKAYDAWQDYRATYVKEYNDSLERAKPGLNYVNSFLRDVNSFYNRYNRDVQENGYSFDAADFFTARQNEANDLKRRRSEAERYLDENRSFYSDTEYKSLMDSLSTFDTDIDDVLSYYQNVSNTKAGMRAYEDEYKAYLEDQAGKKQAMYDTAAVVDSPAAYVLLRFAGDMVSPVQRGITDQWTDEQRYILGTLQNEDPIEARNYARNVNKGQDPFQIAAANEQEEQELLALDLTAAQRELDELNAQYDNYQYDASTFRGRMAAEADLKRMEQEISQKQQIINRAKLIQERERLGAVSSNDDFATMSAYQEGINDPVYAYVNSAYGAREFMDRAHNPAIKDAYDQMTEEEIANYNYHYATGGREQAQRYLDTIAETLNQRKAGKMYESIKGQTAKELLFGAGVGLNQAAEGFQNLFSSDDYIAPSAYQIAGGMVREDLVDVGGQLPEFLGGGSLGQVGYDLINTAANMAPSMAIGALNPIAGTLTMGASAAGNAYQEALNEGYSKQQARTYSALVGASEAGLEYLMGGISSLGGLIPGGIVEKMLDGVDNAFKRFAIEMGGSMIGEGFEEGLQEVLTPYFQNLALNTDKDVNWNEVAYSALLGALSGGVMEAPGTAANAISYSLRNRPGTGSSYSASAPSTPALTEKDIKAKVAEDGKSRIISTGENVGVNDFHSIKGGEATILLENGNSAPMDDVNFASTEEAARFMTIKSLPGIETEAANDLYHAMKDNNAGSDTDTIVGVRDAYALGYYGFQKSDATKNGTDAAKLSPALRTAAFEAGQKQRSMNAAVAPKVATPSASVKPASGYKRVVFEGKPKLDKKTRAEVRFMDLVAEKFSGTTVHVYQSFKGKGGKYYYRDTHGKIQEAPNGMYVNDEIWIDLNSGDKGEGLALNTFAHEMYHHVEKWNQKGAQKLAEFVVKELGMTDVKSAVNDQIKKATAAGYTVEYWMKNGNSGKGMTREQAINYVEQRAMSDFVADSLETMFSRGDAAEVITRLKEEDRGLFDKIKEFIDQWVSTLKQWYSDKTISEEGKKVAQLERFEELQKLFLEAVEEAGANYNAALQSGEQKSTTPESDVKYSVRTEQRITMSMTDSERAEILKNKSLVAEVYTGQANNAIDNEKYDLESNRDSLIKSALLRIGEEFKVFTDYKISDVDVDIRLSRGNLKESVSKKINPTQIAKLLPVLKTAVENAVGIECHTNRYFYDNDTVMFENLIGGYVDGDKFIPVRFGLKHSKNGEATLYLIVDQNSIDINKIKAEVAKEPAAQKSRPETSRSAFKISISSVIPFVNSKDMLRYLPDDLLNEHQKEAKYEAIAETIVYTNDKNDRKYTEYIRKGNLSAAKQMVQQAAKVSGYTNLFYHGAKKGGGFTRFREWSYFTENKGYAERYAQRDNPDSLYEVFAKMEKPFDTREADARAIFDDIRSEYGLSEIQDSGLPDWTDGYDITDYIDENQLNYDSVVLDEGGDLVDGKPISRGLSYIIRKSEQVKSADVITYDDSGNIIPISQRFNPEKEDIRYSLRNAPENIHDVRRRIAAGMDDAANTGNLKKWAGEYREKIAQAEAIESNLKIKDQQIQELESSKNPTDKQKFYALRREVNQMRDELGKLNKRIQYIESLKAFRDISASENASYGKSLLQQMRNQQAENIQQQLIENRIVREELTGKDSDITIMEKEFIRIAKKYEQLDAKTGKKIADLRNALKAEADSHKAESRLWQREFNRLLREYETSGRKIERLEATIARQRATAKARVQSRRNTEMRNKIQRRASELDRMLRNGTRTSYVPEGLREPVAAILEAIDLRKSDKETKVAQHLRDLRLAYYDIRSNSDPNIRSIFDEGLSDHLETLTKEVGDTKLGDMTTHQLEGVHDILTAVLETVRNANEAFAESKKAKISEMSDAAMRQIRSSGKEKYRGKMDSDFVKGLKSFMWNDMRPVDIFDAIGSSEMMNLFRNIRKGEDVWAKDIQEARDFFRQQWQKNKGDDWDMTQQHTFTSASGMDFQLSLDQIMSIYALFRRDKDQAMAHLRQGGFVFDNNVVDKKGKSHTDATAYNLTDDTILNIIGTLNADQMAFVESMQGYLSDTMGAKGNDVSMKLYGIKLFREKNYFPIRSAEQYMERAKAQQRGEVKIKNSGFTKPVTPNANTPIVLSSFMDVWGSHVDEMSNYHAFVLPIEDMYRVYNYRTDISNEESASRSVQAAIQNAYGAGAVKAIDQLLKDINGGVRSDSTAGFLNKLISRYKKGATMASLSVAAQQPSAIMRAAAMIDWKYFVGPKPTANMTGRTWDEIKKHAPIAIIKEIGGFDTNTGRVASEFLTKMEYQGFEEQFKAFFKDGQFRDDVLGRLPAWADEISWGVIWNAVKREQKSQHPNMDVTSDVFLNKVAERFTDVIVHTQVYDSVLAKNAMMRSKDTGMKMVTSFMAEPTVTANMMASAITRAIRKGDKAGAVKTISAVVASTLFNAAASSVVYALRDDDEDERYGEKWIASFRENLLESVNPMGYIPLLRDVNNIIAGYDIERADMSIVSDFAEAVKSLGNEDMSDWEKVEKFAGAVANIFGVPLKNVTRDLKGVWNTLRTGFGAKNTATKTGAYMAATGKNLSDGEQLLLAIQRGDEAHWTRVAERFDSLEDAVGALKTAIGSHYKDGSMTESEATDLLMTYGDMDEDEIYWKIQEWDHGKAKGNTENYSKFGALHQAIESGEGIEAEIDRYVEHGTDNSDIRSDISRVYKKEYLAEAVEDREAIRQKVTPAYAHTGMDEDEIESKFNDWDFEAKYGMSYSEYKAGYLDDSVSRFELEDAMKFYGMKNYQISKDIRQMDEDKKLRDRFGMSLTEMKDAYDDGDVSRNQLINALVYNGMTQKEASQEVAQRDIRNRLGIDYSELDDAYKHGDISRQAFYDSMIKNGATTHEADEAIRGYDWLKKHVKRYPDLTISDGKKFAVSLGDNAEGYTLEDYGVSIDSYIDYKQKLPECQGVDANGDGKTDSGTKRDAIFRMIDSLPISDYAKDGLALMSYSKNSIKKNAPWH